MDLLLIVGLVVVGAVVGSIVRELLERAERKRGKKKTCPDCAEVAGASAEWCTACGYRFQSDRPRGGGGLGLPL